MENVTDFDFYIKFTKPLILSLPKIKDRVLAAAWVKRLSTDSEIGDKIKLDHLKLLLFVLQRKRLTHPFTEHPNNIEVLTEFPENHTLIDVAKSLIEQEHEERLEKFRKNKESGDYPPYVSDFSADLLEYTAVQEIRNFGVHGYYAISKLPLSTWYRVDKHLLPKAAKSMIEVSPGPAPLLGTSSSPEITEAAKTAPPSPEPAPPEAPPEEEPHEGEPSEGEPPEEKPPDEEAPEEEKPEPPSPKKSPRKSVIGASPPSIPIGKILPKEDRSPPTWGTNLLEFKDIRGEEAGLLDGTGAEILWSSPQGSPPKTDDMFGDMGDWLGDDFLSNTPPSFLQTSLAEAVGSPIRDEAPSLPYLTPSPRRAALETWDEAPSLPYLTPPQRTWSEAPSLPYLTPGRPWVTPPPPGKPTPPPRKLVKKPGPVIRPTRASLLLQKKKEAAEAPPPPPEKKPIKKKGKKIGRRPSKTPSGQVAPADLDFDGLNQMLNEFDQVLQKAETTLREEQAQQAAQAEPAQQVQVTARRGIPRFKGKSKISRIARASLGGIPKKHDAPVSLDESIHLSEDARQILDQVAEEVGAKSPIREPQPRLEEWGVDVGPGLDEEDMPDLVDEDLGEELEDEAEEQAGLKSSPGHGKDHRISDMFNKMADTSVRIEGEGVVEGLDLDIDGLDVDIANISGHLVDIDQALSTLQAEVAEVPSSVAHGPVQVLAVEPVASEPEVPKKAPVKKVSKRAIPQIRPTKASLLLQKKKTGQPPPPEKKAVKKKKSKTGPAGPSKEDLEHQQLVQAALDADDFEEAERLIEAQMQKKGQDPKARAKQAAVDKKKNFRRFMKMHKTVDAQLDALQEEEERQLDIRQQMEDLYRRLQPNVPPEQRTPPGVSRHKAIRDLAAKLPKPAVVEAAPEEEEFMDAVEFFRRQDQKFSPAKDPRAKPASHVFPEVEFGVVDEDLGDEIVPDLYQSPPTSAERRKELANDIELLYAKLAAESPGLQHVPVTTPKPSATPKRPPDTDRLLEGATPPGLLAESPTVPDSPTDAFGLPLVTASPLKPLSERRPPKAATPKAPTPKKTPPGPTPPQAPSPPIVDLEDDMFFTTPPEELPPMSPAKWDYESPPRRYYDMKPLPFEYKGDISPYNALWREDKEEYLANLKGTIRVPTVFDIPVDRLAGETPPKLASPVERRPLSPEIDTEALKAEIRRQVPTKFEYNTDHPVYRRDIVDMSTGKVLKLNRYSHPQPTLKLGERVQTQKIAEISDQLEEEDIEMQEEIKAAEKVTTRRAFQFPQKRGMRTVERHSAAPKWAQEDPLTGKVRERWHPIKEVIEPSPPKTKPDLFDIPQMFDVGVESPPHDVFRIKPTSPPPSPANPEEWKASVQAHAMEEYAAEKEWKVKSKKMGKEWDIKKAPPGKGMTDLVEGVEYLPQEELEHRSRIRYTAWPPLEFKKKKPTPLSPVEEHIEYWSPTTSRPAPGTPRGTQGPRRVAVRKRLKKRKIDFSQPESPDESQVQTEEVHTEVGEERDIPSADPLAGLELDPDFYERFRPFLGRRQAASSTDWLTSPKTPVQRLDQIEGLPDIPDLPEMSPPTPLSHYGVIEGTMAKVKEHEYVKRDQRGARVIKPAAEETEEERKRRLHAIEEVPFEERAAVIHDQLEAEVEAELAAKAAAERAKLTLLDTSIPKELPAAMSPQRQVPFYTTPPHLRRPSPKKAAPQIDIWPKAYRDVLTHEEMPELVSPDLPSPPAFQFPPGYHSPRRVGSPAATRARASPLHSLFDEAPPEGYGIIPSPTKSPRHVPSLFDEAPPDGYGIIPSPTKSPRHVPSPRRSPVANLYAEQPPEGFGSPVSPPKTAADIERIAQMQYEQLGGTPVRPPPVEYRAPELSPFEMIQDVHAIRTPPGGILEEQPPVGYTSPATPRTPRGLDAFGLPMLISEMPQARPPPSPVGFEGADWMLPTPPRRLEAVSQGSPGLTEAEKREATMSGESPHHPEIKHLQAVSGSSPGLTEFEKMEATMAGGSPHRAASPRSPGMAEFEEMERLAAAEAGGGVPGGPRTAEELQRIAEAQYAALADSPRAAAGARSMDEVQRLAEAQYAALAASPRRSPQAAPSRSEIEFEYKEKVTEAKPKSKKAKKKKSHKKKVEYDSEALEELGVGEADLRRVNLSDLPDPPKSPQPPYPLPLPIRPASPGSPPPEHMDQMYKALETTEARMYPLPVPAGKQLLPTKYKFQLQRLKKLEETEEEHKPPSPMGWDMHWDLSPQRRVDRRVPDVQVLPSPIKESRFNFERVELEEPPKAIHHRLLPLAIQEEQKKTWPYYIDPDVQINLGIDYEEMPELEAGVPGPDVFERIERLEETEATPDKLGEALELPYEDLGLEAQPELYHTPPRAPFVFEPPEGAPSPPLYESPIRPRSPSPRAVELQPGAEISPPRYESPIRRKSASPRAGEPGAEIRMEEVYDPESEMLERISEIAGTVPEPPEGARTYEDVMATADAQYAQLMSQESPKPPTPSPERFRRQLQQLPKQPELFQKEKQERFKQRFAVEHDKNLVGRVPYEALEELEPEEIQTTHYLPPPGMFLPALPPKGEMIGEVSPPHYTSPKGTPSPKKPDIWDLPAPEEASPPEYYSPQSVHGDEDLAAHYAGGLFDQPSPGEVSPPFRVSPQVAASPATPKSMWSSPPPWGEASPTAEYGTPPPMQVPHHIRGMMPSPVKPKRYEHQAAPIRIRDELPEVIVQPRYAKIPTPSPMRPTKSQGVKPVGRRIDFDQPPPSPDEPVQTLTVGPPTAAEQAVIDQLTTPPRDPNAPFGGRTSPGIMDTSPIQDVEIPEHLRNFRWMDQ